MRPLVKDTVVGDKQGYLFKLGVKGFNPGWKRRYFVLSLAQERLYYFVNEHDHTHAEPASGFVNLKDVSDAYVSFSPPEKGM
jgi:PH domain